MSWNIKGAWKLIKDWLHIDHIIIEIGSNTEECHGEPRKLALTVKSISNYVKICKQYNNNDKTCEFIVPADHRLKIKENEIIDKFLTLAR